MCPLKLQNEGDQSEFVGFALTGGSAKNDEKQEKEIPGGPDGEKRDITNAFKQYPHWIPEISIDRTVMGIDIVKDEGAKTLEGLTRSGSFSWFGWEFFENGTTDGGFDLY